MGTLKKTLVVVAVLAILLVFVARPHLHYHHPQTAVFSDCNSGFYNPYLATQPPCKPGVMLSSPTPGYYELFWGDRRY